MKVSSTSIHSCLGAVQVDSSEDTVVVDNIDDIRSLLISLLIYPFRISNIWYELDVTKLQKNSRVFPESESDSGKISRRSRSWNRNRKKFFFGIGVSSGCASNRLFLDCTYRISTQISVITKPHGGSKMLDTSLINSIHSSATTCSCMQINWKQLQK